MPNSKKSRRCSIPARTTSCIGPRSPNPNPPCCLIWVCVRARTHSHALKNHILNFLLISQLCLFFLFVFLIVFLIVFNINFYFLFCFCFLKSIFLLFAALYSTFLFRIEENQSTWEEHPKQAKVIHICVFVICFYSKH